MWGRMSDLEGGGAAPAAAPDVPLLQGAEPTAPSALRAAASALIALSSNLALSALAGGATAVVLKVGSSCARRPARARTGPAAL